MSQLASSNTTKKNKEIDLSKLPWWVFILLAVGLVLTYLILADKDYRDTFIYLQAGIRMTLTITMVAFPISIIIGLFLGLARTSKNLFLYTIGTLYIEIVRGIPLVVLLLTIAFAIVPLGITIVRSTAEWGLTWLTYEPIVNMLNNLSDPYLIRRVPMEMRAMIALGIGYGAYEAEVFRAGIQSIGRGQIEASRSLGMNYWQTMRYIVLPQAIRRVLPPLGNDFISLLKDSSLATVLAVNELTQLSRLRRGSTFRVIETFNVVAYLYLALTLVLSAGVRFLEKKMKFEE